MKKTLNYIESGTNYFQGNSKHPQHISVGAIVINEKGQVCAKRFTKNDIMPYLSNSELDKIDQDIFLLMRETIHPNESLEDAVERGLKEEMGIKADLVDYIGSICSGFYHNDTYIQKTTLYFVCKLINQDDSITEDDVEGRAETVWKDIDYLIESAKQQSKDLNRTDLDESIILEKYKKSVSV